MFVSFLLSTSIYINIKCIQCGSLEKATPKSRSIRCFRCTRVILALTTYIYISKCLVWSYETPCVHIIYGYENIVRGRR